MIFVSTRREKKKRAPIARSVFTIFLRRGEEKGRERGKKEVECKKIGAHQT